MPVYSPSLYPPWLQKQKANAVNFGLRQFPENDGFQQVTRVCAHFEDDQFESGFEGRSRKLKSTAVPTRFSFNKRASVIVQSTKRPQNRLKICRDELEMAHCSDDRCPDTDCNFSDRRTVDEISGAKLDQIDVSSQVEICTEEQKIIMEIEGVMNFPAR